MGKKEIELSVGEMSTRSGVAVSTLHFYEKIGLIKSNRNRANHRRYLRSMLRRIAIIRLAQLVGFSLKEISNQMEKFPLNDNISGDEWQLLAENWFDEMNYKIALLTELRDKMGSCIGCGCLSVNQCLIYNKDDWLESESPGTPLLTRRIAARVAP